MHNNAARKSQILMLRFRHVRAVSLSNENTIPTAGFVSTTRCKKLCQPSTAGKLNSQAQQFLCLTVICL